MDNKNLSDSPFVQREALKRRRGSASDENMHKVTAKKTFDDDDKNALSNGTVNQSVIGCERPIVTPQTLNGVHQETVVVVGKKQRKLVLHFDVRNTILVSDSVTKDNVEQALNAFLAGVTWGRWRRSADGFERDAKPNTPQCMHVTAEANSDHVCGDWVWCSDRPSLSAPCPGAVTYYKGLERRLVHSIPDRLLLRRATGDFTQQPIGRRFRSFFDEHLKLLECDLTSSSHVEEFSTQTNDTRHKIIVEKNTQGNTRHEEKRHSNCVEEEASTETANKVPSPKLYISGSDGRTYHYLMPSFVRMMYDLSASDRQFTVILRTYGVDAHNVLASVSHIASGHHPLFPGSLSFDVCPNPGSILRFPDGRIRCELPWSTAAFSNYNLTVSPSTAVVLEDDFAIYKTLSNSDGIKGIVDDFGYWQSNEFEHLAGKPLWIDPSDDQVQHIFFDDNIRATDCDSIVNVRFFDDDAVSGGVDRSHTCRSLALDEISSLENVCLVQADLLECISDVNYFKRKIDECEVNYETWLMQRRRTKAVDKRLVS